jgi:hypothetical protein
MPRLRFRACVSEIYPVAAELLEARTLLSGAATAHAAAHFAAEQTQAPKPVTIHKSDFAEIQIDGGGIPAPGTTTLVKFQGVMGAKVTAHVSYAVTQNGQTISVKGTIIGTIKNIEIQPSRQTFFELNPAGGSLTITEINGGHREKAKALPTINPIDLTFKDGTLFVLSAWDRFVSKAPADLANKDIILTTGPGP